jgi:hypothetical protein
MVTALRAAANSPILVAVMVLASCGGGSSSGSTDTTTGGSSGTSVVPTTILALTATNAQDIASGATLTGLGTSSIGTQFQNALAVQPLLPRTHVLSRFIRQEIDRLTRGLQTAPSGPVAAATMTSPCTASGSVSRDQGTTSATETFSACSEEAGSSVSGTITIDNMTLDPGVSFSGSAGINLTFSQAGFADVNIAGSNVNVLETVNVTVNTITLSGVQILATTGANVESLSSFTLVAAIDPATETDTITFKYASTKIGGSVDVSTVTPCVTDTADNRGFPKSGVLSLAGAGGSMIQVTVNGDESFTTSSEVTIAVDADGNGTFETTIGKNWADLSS